MERTENKSSVVVVGKTPQGKEIGYRHLGYNRFLEVCFKTGGEVPKELQGMWVNPMDLERAIGMYLGKLEAKPAAKTETKPKGKKAE